MNIHDYIPRNAKFSLPGNPDRDIYIVATSGGADSTSLCVLLSSLFPTQEFLFCFTDTGAEDPELYDSLQSLEQYLGREILHIKSERGTFYDLLDAQGNFLPSGNARWCTRLLKVLPFQNWLNSLHLEYPDRNIYNFVGLRADEPSRSGFSSNNGYLHSVFPFQELGMGRQEVFRLLHDTIGIPGFYKYRTRSGCAICPFMRRSELIGLYRWNPESFDTSAGYEKLSCADMERFGDTSVPVWKETGLGSNWTNLPFPPEVDARGKSGVYSRDLRNKAEQALKSRGIEIELPEVDPEEKTDIWFGAEFHVHGLISAFDPSSPGIFWQESVSFSSTKSGLARQLNLHCKHRLDVPETFFMDREEMAKRLRLVTYRVQVPKRLVDLGVPTRQESFTWDKSFAMSQLKQVFNWTLRTLQVNHLYQELLRYIDAPIDSWAGEHRDSTLRALTNIGEPVGELAEMQIYNSKEIQRETQKQKSIMEATPSMYFAKTA